MNRGKPAMPVSASSRQREILKNHRNKHTATVQARIRIDIILSAFEGKSNRQIAIELGISRNTVITWRNRWAESYDELCVFESGSSGQGVSDYELLQKMLEVLSDRARSGSPKRISLEQENQIMAMACKKPKDFGIPITQWNRELLAEQAIAREIVQTISPRYVSVILKKTNYSPINPATG